MQNIEIERRNPLIEIHTEIGNMSVTVYGRTAEDVMNQLVDLSRRWDIHQRENSQVPKPLTHREILNG